MTVGFIGLGIMGAPMCANIIKKSGCEVYVYDVNEAAAEPLVELGAKKASSSRELCEKSAVVFSMVPKTEHVEAVYSELIPAAREGQLFIDMSTISPNASRALAKRIAEKGAVMLDAPVVKSKPAAIAGELGIYVGGDETAFEKALPLLKCMGSNVIRMGDNGTGLVMKLCHNSLVAQIQNGVNETMRLAKEAADIDPLTFAKAISYGGGQNFYLDGKAKVIAARDFTTAFSVENMNKDAHLSKTLCEECGFEAKGIELAAERYEAAMEKGLGKMDFSATYLLMED